MQVQILRLRYKCRARKPFDPQKLWELANKYFYVQQPEVHDHDHGDEDGHDCEDEIEETGSAGKKRSAMEDDRIRCPDVRNPNALKAFRIFGLCPRSNLTVVELAQQRPARPTTSLKVPRRSFQHQSHS